MAKPKKITYSDEFGVDTELEENSNNSKTPARIFVFFLVLSFIMGVLGGVGSLVLLSSNTELRGFLGINNFPSTGNNITKTEKLILEESSAITDATKKVAPAVVSIVSSRDVEDFFGRIIEQKSGGTGFIITNDGLILTNKHVVSDEKADYTVFTADGKEFKAKVLTRDPVNDLAILKIEATGLPVVELGNSQDLQIGQWVIAIGNALGEFQNTVTVGVVSAKERKIVANGSSASESLEDLIQTDAAINPGNSGGPLVNLKGHVVGINTAVAGGAQNIGFAIPINSVKVAIDSYKATGRIVRPMLGVRVVLITKEIAKANKLPVDYGALIYRGSKLSEFAIISGSPADKAGLEEGDIILEINGEKINESNSLVKLIQKYQVGTEVEIKYLRDGKEQTAKAILAELK